MKPEARINEYFSILSRFLNVLSGGTADITLSARAGRDDLTIKPWLDWIFLKIAKERNHCGESWTSHAEMSRQSLIAWGAGRKNQQTRGGQKGGQR